LICRGKGRNIVNAYDDSALARISLRAPVITIVLAATAIPIELRPLGRAALSYQIWASDVVGFVSDVVMNVGAYVLVGIVLAGLGQWWAVLVATSMATFAESAQFVMMHRDPSAIDVASDVIGATLGTMASTRWRIQSTDLRFPRWGALIAATLVILLVLGVWATSGYVPNARGAASPGILEAHWKLDERGGRVAFDSSGHGLDGKFRREPKRIAGVIGGAVTLDGKTDYVDFGHSSALRLVGSLTVSAWINSASFPVDDAAIVSNFTISSDLNGAGYQLDTTIDKGPRTIGFKLANACGALMARYGMSPLVIDTWYHVAGVYDAAAQTLDVYLNGQLDNGFLHGQISGRQKSSREAVYVCRRSDVAGFEFAGSIDDVRIYSRALTKAEIAADMRGEDVEGVVGQRATEGGVDGVHRLDRAEYVRPACSVSSDHEDALLPGLAAAVGVLTAVAYVAIWPSAGPLRCLLVSLAAGLILLSVTPPTLPSLNLWLLPLTSLAGGTSVAVSRHRQTDSGR
jgi:hypothetical protein